MISDWKTSKRIALSDLVADIESRRERIGMIDIPRNSGSRRTESKRALLAAIEELGGKW